MTFYRKTTLLAALYCLLFSTETHAQFDSNAYIIEDDLGIVFYEKLLEMGVHDLDGDGFSDVVLTHKNRIVWHRSDGAANFYNDSVLLQVDLPEQVGFFEARFADLDGDGRKDLAADRFWRKNLGGGSFAPTATVFENPLAELADLDGDQLPDAITCSATEIFWQKNLGNGSFAAGQVLWTAANPLVFTAADLNGDGTKDLLVRADDGGFWLKNLGNATFQAAQLFLEAPARLLAEDFNSDGHTDLFSASADGQINWYTLDGTEQLNFVQQISTKYKSGGLALGDLTQDGHADLMVGYVNTNGEFFPFLESSGLFSNTSLVPSPGFFPDYGLVKIADLNHDGRNDLLVTNPGIAAPSWLRQTTVPGIFTKPEEIFYGFAVPTAIESLDFEGDGDNDILVNNAWLIENLGGGQYAEKRRFKGLGGKGFRADLDGDGLKDLALPVGDGIGWRKNLGNNTLSTPQSIAGALVLDCREVGGGDFDGDGDIDLFAANGASTIDINALFFWFENDGKGNFTPHLLGTGVQQCSGLFALDLDQNGRLDLVLTFFNANHTRWYPNLGNGQFGAGQPVFPAGTPEPLNVVQRIIYDLDLDGLPDLVFAQRALSGTPKVFWYKNLGNGTFSGQKLIWSLTWAGYMEVFITIFDADYDGLPDVAVSYWIFNEIHFVRATAPGVFAPHTVVHDEIGSADYHMLAHHDYDGDGKLDLLFGRRHPEDGTPLHQLCILKNVSPGSGLFAVTQKSASCSDNQTPNDATDDILTIALKVNGSDNSSTQYTVSNLETGAVRDTFFYGQNISFSLPPGSAGDGSVKRFVVRDLIFPSATDTLSFDAGKPCSATAPAVIQITNVAVSCHDNGTPNDPTDDKVVFWFTPKIYNQPFPTTQFYLSSNLGWAIDPATSASLGFYAKENYFELPPGSAAIAGDVVLTLHDVNDFGIVQQLVLTHPGTCSGASLPCPLSVVYHRQSEIDSFPIKFPGCRVLSGELTVHELLPAAGVPRIENLLGFQQLLEVHGDVNINRTHLQNLSGLDSLRLVGRDLGVQFFDSPDLETLVGLGGLQKIGRDFWLSDTQSALQNFTGVENLDTIGGQLFLWHLGGVKNLEGFSSLKSAGISVSYCDALESLKGLESLESARWVSLTANGGLESLDGLQGLKTIEGDTFAKLQILDNPVLHDLLALHHPVSIPALQIERNPGLSTCSVKAICQYLENDDPARTMIAENLTGCNTADEVESSCLVSTGETAQNFDFQVSPNPLSAGQPLQILLENDFFGTVKIEFLSLDGRVLQIFFKEKTAENLGEILYLDDVYGSFFLRVSDGKTSATRLVVKF